MSYPKIIQGGMGVAVSGYRLARAVSEKGHLGVVSGTALDVVLARRLQIGDPDGTLRRALAAFPFPDMAEAVLRDYFVEGGLPEGASFKGIPLHSTTPSPALIRLTVISNFVEVYLAKEGHAGLVGINFLEKIQLPTLPSLFGAMLAGADYVLMGAGIPRAIPEIMDRLAQGLPVRLKLDVQECAAGEEFFSAFDPASFCGGTPPTLKRPRFLAIIASATLAMTLARKASGHVDGFIVEAPTAGGHNAPPRGTMQLSDTGEPVYGERDVVDLEKIKALGRPFWLAGAYGRPGKLAEALALGAEGIQVGTAFAFCEESGVDADLRHLVLELAKNGGVEVFTDRLASPTGFPFKVARVPGSLSDPGLLATRKRVCDLGYLRQIYLRPDGTLGYRCPAEPAEDYLRKGGAPEELVGRECVCNGLMATAGLPQMRRDGPELPLVTAGDALADISQFFLGNGKQTYSAADVIDSLLA